MDRNGCCGSAYCWRALVVLRFFWQRVKQVELEMRGRSKKRLKVQDGNALKERITQLEAERHSFVLAFGTLEKKYEETKAQTFKRMASKAIEQADKIQSEIEQIRSGTQRQTKS